MGLFRSDLAIGRGEVAESRLDYPYLCAAVMLCAFALLAVQLLLGNEILTAGLAMGLMVLSVTVARPDLGIVILIASMLLSPELAAGSVGRGVRSLNIRLDDILIIAIFLGVLAKRAAGREPYLWRPNPVNPAIAIYLLVCVASTARAVMLSIPAWDKATAFFVGLKMLEFFMIFLIVSSAVRGIAQIRFLLKIFFLVALIVIAYCVSQIGSGARLSAPFEQGGTEPNTLGGYLVIVMCVAVALHLHVPSAKAKLWYAFLAAAAFVPFLFSLSRASYVALCAAMITLGLAARKLRVLVAVALLFALFPLMPAAVKDRVNYTFQRGDGEPIVVAGLYTGLQVDKATYERIYVWKKVGWNLRAWPLLGGGIAWDTVLDSQYARVLMETGLIGFGAFVFLLYRLLRVCRETHRWSRDWLGRGLAVGMAAATVGIAVHSLGTITFLIVRVMEPYWFLMALTVVLRQRAFETARSLGTGPSTGPSRTLGPLPRPQTPETPPRLVPPAYPVPAVAAAGATAMYPVDINHASLSVLETLPGVGAALAQQIIQCRRNTPFHAIDDLLAVKGIGPRKLEALRTLVVLDSETEMLRGSLRPLHPQLADPDAVDVCVSDALSALRRWRPEGDG